MTNITILSGNLTRDPELKSSKDDKPVVKLRIAVTGVKRKGQDKSDTDYFDVVAFGVTAENANRYLSKGRAVLVEGHQKNNDWTDTDGNKHYGNDIIADRIDFLSGGKRANGADASDDEPEEVAAGSDDFDF